jgi:uncharacterized repeat protein (TIGR01451 family)
MSTEWRFGGKAAFAAAAAILVLALAAVLLVDGGPGKASAAALDPADLSLNLSDSPDPVSTGATLTYSIKVHNAGPDAATNTSVTESLPGGVSFVTASASGGGTCKKTGNKIVCDLGTVTTTADRTVTIKAAVTKKSGSVTASASVGSDVTDPAPANNLDSETTTIAKPPEPIKCAGEAVTILGTDGPDTLVGTFANDVIRADDGDDVIYGFGGGDVICGGTGTDKIRAGRGNDEVLGGRGSDFIRGKRGDDALHGERGRDRLRGGRGDDLVSGGDGFDRCHGGPGLDALRGCERPRHR